MIEMNEMMTLTMNAHMNWIKHTTANKTEKLNSVKKGIKNMMENGEYDKLRKVFNASTLDEAFKLI